MKLIWKPDRTHLLMGLFEVRYCITTTPQATMLQPLVETHLQESPERQNSWSSACAIFTSKPSLLDNKTTYLKK
ncbi:hypothetical protein EVAR_70022_1 [Eumeta japonica]|uniref:Uncharacterized protein n=1 Tax=Eumeta variegata TaxID=151549 RepID=A0A4C1SWE1_EUMVA|nr:hypothetical protein EVAR_70022_1 [Eumeta japonica]